MKSKSDVEKELARIKSDERLSYPPANVFINAPLALIQQDLESRVAMLQWVLEGDGAVEHTLAGGLCPVCRGSKVVFDGVLRQCRKCNGTGKAAKA